MDTSKILTADFIDIVFDGRNKTYGAYELRKHYVRRLLEAVLATIVICLIVFFVPKLFSGIIGKKQTTTFYVNDVSLENIKENTEKKKEVLPPPPPPPIKQEVTKVEIKRFTPPVIVKDYQVKEVPPEQKEILTAKIGTINQEGVKDQGLITTAINKPAVEIKSVVPNSKKEDDYDKIFTVVEIPAHFPGGADGWRKYLERNLNRDIAVQNGAPLGTYIVQVSFVVDKSGFISDVKAQNDPGYGTKEEAIRVIKNGPNWEPAVQNGRNVNYRHVQNIVFVVADSNE